MGVRQSQDQPPGASPVEVGGPQVSPHRPRAMPTPEDYTHLHRAPQLSAARPHGQRGLSEGDSRGVNLDPRGLNLDSRELLQLDLALSRLQQRLASRANADATARDRPHSHQSPRVRPHQTHSAHSYDGSAMPFIFVRGISSVKCPLCSKEVMSGAMEEHLASCMTRPRVTYNSDTVVQELGECSICLDDMLPGDEIARLPCLCVYHLKCLQQWFKINETCPEHPDLS